MRAFEYRVNDEDSEILGTAIILEVMITRHHAKTRRQVRIVMRIMILRDKHVSEDSEQL